MNLLTDDTDHIENEALQQRQQAFQGMINWHGKPLRWTISRASLYALLRVPLPRLSAETLAAIRAAKDDPDLQHKANALYEAETAGSDQRFRNACIILYLAANSHEAWQSFSHDRVRFLNAIETWIDDHVAPSELLELADITTRLIEQAESTRAKVRPSGNPDDDEHAGN